jgi:hypothetical protein
MTTRDFTANVISASKVVPDGNFKDSKASGVWDINEALDLIKGGNWPNAANLNPAAFVDALFQTHLYTGTASNRDITNNVDLTKGGLVWTKARTNTGYHHLFDTERGVGKAIFSNDTVAETTYSTSLTAFNNNGFSLGNSAQTGQNEIPFVSWTFRKQPKFFDIVTYTGNGSARTISHSLGSVPGMILINRLNYGNWVVYHRGANGGTNPEEYELELNATSAQSDSTVFSDTAPTSTEFSLNTFDSVNSNGVGYVAYLFAHNNNDGGFGEPGDQDIIKCGSYTGNGNSTGPTVDLGFEPQWILQKSATKTNTDWAIADVMRGFTADGVYQRLRPNRNDAEGSETQLAPTSTGFKVVGTASDVNTNGETYIYMAIRRGGMQTPTAASSVFHANKFTSTGFTEYTGVGFAPDLAIQKAVSDGDNWDVVDKLRGPSNYIKTNSTDAEAADTQYELGGFLNNGVKMGTSTSGQFNGWNPNLHLYWRRARGYFDVVTYTGTGSATTVAHNLGVAPEMIWFKCRSNADIWTVYHSALGEGKRLKLDNNTAVEDDTSSFNNTAPTSSVFSIGTVNQMNGSGRTFVAYLFATVANVSKVGSFTQSGATNVDCGFTGDTPSFLLLKRTDDTDNWRVYDAVRGLVAGNDKVLNINRNVAQSDDSNLINPNSGGFATTSTLTNGDYIFYAIASIA